MKGEAVDPDDIDFTLVGDRMEINITTTGRALAASLFTAVLDRWIKTFIYTPGKELVMNDEGPPLVYARSGMGTTFLSGLARKGVMIASGGFERNKELVQSFLKGRITRPQPRI